MIIVMELWTVLTDASVPVDMLLDLVMRGLVGVVTNLSSPCFWARGDEGSVEILLLVLLVLATLSSWISFLVVLLRPVTRGVTFRPDRVVLTGESSSCFSVSFTWVSDLDEDNRVLLLWGEFVIELDRFERDLMIFRGELLAWMIAAAGVGVEFVTSFKGDFSSALAGVNNSIVRRQTQWISQLNKPKPIEYSIQNVFDEFGDANFRQFAVDAWILCGGAFVYTLRKRSHVWVPQQPTKLPPNFIVCAKASAILEE